MTRAALTPKQQRFVAEYLSNGRNGAEAYRTAYTTKATPARAATEAQRLLAHPRIAPIIAEADRREAEALNRVVDRYAITTERIANALARLGFYDARDIFEWEDGRIRLRSSATISDDAAAAITEISQTITEAGGTIKVKLADKRAALVDLGKHLGMFSDKLEVKGTLTLEALVLEKQRQKKPT